MSNTKNNERGKVIGVPMKPDQLDRFYEYKRKRFEDPDSVADAVVARELILERLKQLEGEAA